ncbi:glycosyltransferase family 39 protein [Patescibacteria group bacterium]|nr:glycosyltransferase family 39 protein [Patescibacteria group bacterium]MBU1931634.1 glycosyltransferase family 39 protein [Patescibacteria group bacterium]
MKLVKKPMFWIMFGALVLRLIGLNQSLWLDEGVQVQTARLSLRQLFVQHFPSDFNPPLSYLITYFWLKLFGASEISLRLPSVIFGLASVYLLYLISNELFPKKKLLSRAAALLMATAPLHIYYSQEVRPYSLACFLVLAAVYWFLRLVNNPSKRCARCYTLCVVLMLYSHYLTWLMLPVFWLGTKLLKPNKKTIKSLLFTNYCLLIAIFPWLPFLFKQLRFGWTQAASLPVWGQTVGSVSLKSLVLVPLKFTIGRISLDNNLVYALLLLPVLSLIGALLFRAWQKKTKPALFVWLWLILPLGLGALISLKLPVFFYFRFLFVLPAFYLLLLWGLQSSAKKHQAILLEALLAINLICSTLYLAFPCFHRENWRRAVQALHLRNQQAAPVLIIPEVSQPFAYYDQGESKLLTYGQIDQLSDQNFVWLVKYAQPIFEPDNKTEKMLIKNRWQSIYEADFRGVTIKKFISLKNER